MRRALSAAVRSDVVAGVLLITAALAALVWANTAGAGYASVRGAAFGPSALHLHLSVGEWAADGVLAIFFFTVGLELKGEFAHGQLADRSRAVVPVTAAVGGVVVPALVFVVVTAIGDRDALGGWAVPTATDIAFALAVLAIAGRGLPPALRAFLLALAAVDDLIAVVIIAAVYGDALSLPYLAAALGAAALFALLVHRRVGSWPLWGLVALVCWTTMHASGVHATIAGVLLGLAVPAGEMGTAWERAWRPVSSMLAVPTFALFAAGVDVGGLDGLGRALGAPVTLAVLGGLLIGKPAGVLLGAWIPTRVSRAHLDPTLRWPDIAAAGVLAGIGFTVSLLVGDLAFGGSGRDNDVKVAVVVAAVIVGLVAPVVLRLGRARRRIG